MSGASSDAKPHSIPTYEFLVDVGSEWVLGVPSKVTLDATISGPGKDYFFLPLRKNQYWLPILVGLRNISVKDFAAGEQFAADDLKKQWKACTVFPDLDLAGIGADAKDFYCAPMVAKAFFDLLDQRPELRDVVTSVTLGLPLDNDSFPKSILTSPPIL